VNNLEVVLIHLGGPVPKYLISNILNIQAQFPNISLNLIVDEMSSKGARRIPGLKYHFYSPSPEVDRKLIASFAHVPFRGGYWRLTYERIIALTDFHQSIPTSPILHIESDILTLENFPMREISQLSSTHWLASDGEKDVASLIFIPNLEESLFLKQELLSELSMGQFTSDMQSLHRIRQENPTRIKLFPSMFSDAKMYGGIFDPAAYGMWLTGIDPRNNFGLTKYFDTQTIEAANFYVKPQELEYSLKNGNLFANSSSGERLPIYCLHIHSKNKRLLSTGYLRPLARMVEKAESRKTETSFSFSVLLGTLWMNIGQGTLVEYLGNIPPVRKIWRILNSKN
jgi:hypothetical protein